MYPFIIPAVLLTLIFLFSMILILKRESRRKKARLHLHDLLNRKAYDYAVFDIRTEKEYSRSHLPSAVHFPLEDIDYLPLEDMFLHIFISGSKPAEIRKAVKFLSDNGYFNVYNLGPFSRWKFEKQKGYYMGIEEFAQLYENRKKNESI